MFKKERAMKTLINTIGFIIILILLILFAVENNQPAELKYFGFTLPVKTYLLALIPFFIGVVCGNILDVIKRFRLKKEIRRLRRELVKAEESQYQEMP
jgi:uncharacterized integral membrane protein